MKNKISFYFFPTNTELGISIHCIKGIDQGDHILLDDLIPMDDGNFVGVAKHQGRVFDTPEEAVDHLMGKMLMKVAHLRSEAQILQMAMIDFQELERTNPKGE